ncbi:hypothetical protein STEG23_036622, partial [Scotinomys teguina]
MGEGEMGIGSRKPFNIHHLEGEDDRLRILSKMSLGFRLTSDYCIDKLISLGVYPWVGSQGENEKVRITSKLIKIRFDWGRPPGDLGYRHEGKGQERLQDRLAANEKLHLHPNKLFLALVTISNHSHGKVTKFCLLGVLLAPIRVLLAFVVLFLLWPFAWLQVAGLTEEQLQEPITGWRKTVCHNGVLGLSRLLFFLLGFLRIRVRGQRASRLEAPVLVAAPHSTFFDPIVLLPCDLPKVVSRAENLSVPVIGALLRFNQAILVSRHDPASRRRVVEEVRRRATSGGKWPQVLFFPEGTCSNKKALLKFKPGAFIAGVPVQPVLIRYPNSLDTTSWAWRGPGVLKVLWLTASQPCSIVDVEFLPVYQPSPEESKDPTLYANNVQRVMAQALGIPATECEFVGSLPVIVVGQLKVALEPRLWELGKVLQKAGLSPGCVDTGAEPGRSRMISQEAFAQQLQLSDPQTVAGAFSYFQE